MRDITTIWQRIAETSPATATRFILALQRQMANLETFPLRCPMIPEAVESNIPYRHLIYGSYRTIFSVDADTVRIARVIHGAQLLPPAGR